MVSRDQKSSRHQRRQHLLEFQPVVPLDAGGHLLVPRSWLHSSMRTARLLRWSGSVLSPRTRPQILISARQIIYRTQATAAAQSEPIITDIETLPEPQIIPQEVLQKLPSPPVSAARTSAKLAALHARLSLPSQIPVETLARTLVHQSADSNAKFNNEAMAVFGADILAYYTSEYITSKYPRLPLVVVYAAMGAYCGPRALATIAREWGVQHAAAPGGEVDPGYLQFRHVPPEPKPEKFGLDLIKPDTEGRRRGISSRTVYDDEFGDQRSTEEKDPDAGVTLDEASTKFVRAVVGAVYLHAGRQAAKHFYKDHFMSRHLDMAKLMSFKTPTRDISRLCAREGFLSPVARILSETGRSSRHPVFIVGVFSGKEKLGEGAGASLEEAKIRAAVAALKSWYLYSPLQWRLPSDMEDGSAKPWTPGHVDFGDIVI